jgi:uncharacterized membrane protein
LAALWLTWWGLGQKWNLVIGLAPMAVVAGGIAGWVLAWRQVRPYAVNRAMVRSAPVIGEDEERLPGGWLTIGGPFALLGTAAGWLWTHFDELPQRFPVHWGISGRPDRWVEKSWQAVIAPSAVGAGVLVLILGSALMILYGAKRGAGGETGDFGRRHRRANVQMLAVLAWSLGVVFATVTLLPLMTAAGSTWPMLILLLPLAGVLVMGVRLYKLSVESTGGSDGTPEDCWKLGMFYYNPQDPALMVEKRSGPGFTLNFGHGGAWALMAGLLAFVLVPLLMLR